eukprot:scaffold1172_cov180-Ochromonas_danica.AAC.1
MAVGRDSSSEGVGVVGWLKQLLLQSSLNSSLFLCCERSHQKEDQFTVKLKVLAAWKSSRFHRFGMNKKKESKLEISLLNGQASTLSLRVLGNEDQ